MTTSRPEAAVADNRQVWERLAPWWDEQCADEGGQFHHMAVRPTVLSLLELQTGERVLEAGCGNGWFSRHLAGLGMHVVAFDQAEAFVEAARARSSAAIDFRTIDGTDPAALASLEGPFDAAVANMVLMDMPRLDALFEALERLLRPGGRFVFSIIHPCFGYGPMPAPPPERASTLRTRLMSHSVGVAERLSEMLPSRLRLALAARAGAMTAGMASLRYLEPRQMRAQIAPDQPVPHWYFHRPLHELLRPAFDAGLMLDGLAEPRFWDRETAQPALLACRLRKL